MLKSEHALSPSYQDLTTNVRTSDFEARYTINVESRVYNAAFFSRFHAACTNLT